MKKSSKPKLKIAFVFDDSLDRDDGIQQHIKSLAKYYNDHGHTVSFLVSKSKSSNLGQVYSLAENIKVNFNQNTLNIPLPASKDLIKQILTKNRFDIIHVQMPYSPLLAGRVLNLCPEQTLAFGTVHIVPSGFTSVIGSYVIGLLNRRSQRHLAQVISVSKPAQGFAKRYLGLDSIVIPNPVDNSKYFDKSTLNQPWPNQPIRIGFLGRLVKRKGLAHLLNASKILLDQGLNFQLEIAGDGKDHQKLLELSDQLGLSKLATWHGHLHEQKKIEFLKSIDIAVYPATGGESFGIVLTEAMATGRPIVLAGNNPGYTSVMDNLVNQVFDPFDYQVLAKTITHFAKLNQEQYRKVIDGQLNLVQRYSTTAVGKQTLDLYYKTLK